MQLITVATMKQSESLCSRPGFMLHKRLAESAGGTKPFCLHLRARSGTAAFNLNGTRYNETERHRSLPVGGLCAGGVMPTRFIDLR
jgi:hypothetical protein